MKRYPWKLAVVTGAASGIGRQFCINLAENGCDLIMVDRVPMTDTVSELPTSIDKTTVIVDLTAPDAVEKIFRTIDNKGLKPDLLVNNAGIFDFRQVVDLSPDRIDLYIDLHIRAVTLLSRTMATRMARQGGGYILNMSSMSCWMPMPGIAMYSATKAYIRAFSRALRVEMKDYGVSVTVACPGGIATSLFGLPEKWRRFAVRIGVLVTPHTFVRRALRKMFKRKAQYINGGLNRLSIVAVSMLPEWARLMIKRVGLDRKEDKNK